MMADRKKVEPLLRTARGQIDGVLKMIEDNRYCIDIMMQLQAVESLVHKASRRLQKSSSCWIKRKRKDVPKGTSFFCLKIENLCRFIQFAQKSQMNFVRKSGK